MSEDWRETHCTTVGEIEVCVYDHGGADINWTISDETGSLIPVAKSDRAAVALALLGGITDELVEQLARTLANEFWIISPDEWDLLDPEDHANMRQRAGRLLAAIVGGGEGES